MKCILWCCMLGNTHTDSVLCCAALMMEITVLWDVVDSFPSIGISLPSVQRQVSEDHHQHHFSMAGPQIFYRF